MNKKNILKSLNVLYQEDDVDTLYSTAETIELVVNKLCLSKNGYEGLDIFTNNDIDIIITDLEMPDLNGIEFTKKIREQNPDIPIVFLTAFSNVDYMLSAIDEGIIKYLIKPVEIEALIEVLEDISLKKYEKRNIINLLNGIKVDLDQKVMVKDEKNLKLTSNEIEFLSILNKNKTRAVSEDELSLLIWSEEIYMKKDSLYNLVSKLRKKIGKESIVNISKVGYRLN